MNYKVILDDRAVLEADEAYIYYEKQMIGLGERFRAELTKTIDYIQSNPRLFRKIKKEVRQTLVHKFPYVVVYEIFNETILVYAVFHTSRNPREKFSK